jgi:hypothetical protein
MDVNREWGWKKDPPDPRDFPANRLILLAALLPRNFTIYPATPVYNQGSKPACVGYACAGAKTDQEFTQHGQQYLFDGSWLYDRCKEIDGEPGVKGTYIRWAMKVLQETGMRQQVLPCKKARPDSDWQIGAYYRVPNDATVDLMKQILFQYGSIVVGSWWWSAWSFLGGVFPEPEYTASGGHAWRIIGWQDDAPAGWIVANSWGKLLWGKFGKAVMPYEIFKTWVADKGMADIWKLIDK